jgi:hypothetical protein
MRVTHAYDAAVVQMEIAWAKLRAERAHPCHPEGSRLLHRFRRCLRRCDRLRAQLSELMATGNL